MSDDIIVSGGGSVVVASDAILARVERLGSLAVELRSGADEVLDLTDANQFAALQVPQSAPTLAEARRSLDVAHSLLLSAGRRSKALNRALRVVLDAYGAAEQFGLRLSEQLSADSARLLGAASALLALPLTTSLMFEGALVWGMSGATPKQQAEALAKYVRAHPRLLTNPAIVAAIRSAVENADDFGVGFFGVPPEIARLFGRTDHNGVPLSAAFVLLLARAVGFLSETGISVRQVSTTSDVSPPTSIEGRVERIPDAMADPAGAQIRIDRYSAPGEPDRFDVYIAGTVDFDARSGKEPFDMTSNITGVAHESAASYRAVVDAMKAAGVTTTSPVQLTGYSQGGLVAALVAGSGTFDVKGLVTFGAPSGEVPIPASVPVLTVRHTEDLVPATGGYDVNDAAIVVQRSLFDDQPVPPHLDVPAHRLPYYGETAGLIDAAKSDELRRIRSVFDDFGHGTVTVESTTWLARREPPDR